MNNKEKIRSLQDPMKTTVHTRNKSTMRTDRDDRMCQREVTKTTHKTKKRGKSLGGKLDKKKFKTNEISCDHKTAEGQKEIVSAKEATGLRCLHTGQDDNQSKVSTVTFLGRSNNSRGSSVCTVLQNLPANVVRKWEEELHYSKSNMRSCVYEKYFPDFKFCNQNICEYVVQHSLKTYGLKVTEGMNKQQFVEVTSRNKSTTSIFNNARHGIQSKMRKVYQGEFGRTKSCFMGNDNTADTLISVVM